MTSRRRKSGELRDPLEVAALMARNHIPVPAEDLAAFEAWVESQIPEGASEREALVQRFILDGFRPRPMAVGGPPGKERDELVALLLRNRTRWTPPEEENVE